jgi:hypothetical protein
MTINNDDDDGNSNNEIVVTVIILNHVNTILDTDARQINHCLWDTHTQRHVQTVSWALGSLTNSQNNRVMLLATVVCQVVCDTLGCEGVRIYDTEQKCFFCRRHR